MEPVPDLQELVTLPNGGGALRPISSNFAADLHTGTGNLVVPLDVPAGRNGLTPEVSLAYSTGNGNGSVGLGWELPALAIARRTTRGVPAYDDALDAFELGHDELVPVPGGSARVTRHRPAVEGLFARIEHRVEPGTDVWEMRTRDGLRHRFGGVPADNSPTTVIGRRRRPFLWALTSTEDLLGNCIEYGYRYDPAGADGHGPLHLTRIRWLDHGVGPTRAFLARVDLVHEERPDRFRSFRGGFEQRTTLRVSRIEVRRGAPDAGPMRVYHLAYGGNGGTALPLDGVSLLREVRCEGRDGDESEWLPPLELGYSGFRPQRRRFRPVSARELPAEALADGRCLLADLFGRGLPDIVELGGATPRYWPNRGECRFDNPRSLRRTPTTDGLDGARVQLLDADGDGRLELLLSGQAAAGYVELEDGAPISAPRFHRYASVPTFDLGDPLVRLGESNGDGVSDVMRSGTRLECFFGDRREGWTRLRALPRSALADFPDVSFDDPRVRLADMTGDGSLAIVLLHRGRVDYWPLLGPAEWGPRSTMRHGPDLPAGFDQRRLLLGDVEGDGAADLVYVGDGSVTLWVNRSGDSWSDPVTIRGTPPATDLDAVQLVDLEGSGTLGVLWAGAAAAGRDRVAFLSLTGSAKPYLLDRVDNHGGATTEVSYAPSTRFLLADAQRRATRWRTSLPFPVQVVATTRTRDTHSGGTLTTEYAYRHGHWNGRDREFRGFARVDRRDRETFDVGGELAPRDFSPALELRTWFHVGGVDDHGTELDLRNEFWDGDPDRLEAPPAVTARVARLGADGRRAAAEALRGRVLRTELRGLDASERPYEVRELLHVAQPLPLDGVQPDPPEPWQQRVLFPSLHRERMTAWERGHDPMTRLQLAGPFDAYGQPLSAVDVAVPRGRDPWSGAPAGADPYIATRTTFTRALRDDDEGYVTDRLAVVSTTAMRTDRYEATSGRSPPATALESLAASGELDEDVIGHTVTTYDGPSFEGLAPGRLGSAGLVSRVETLMATDELLERAYAGSVRPPYLDTGPQPDWTRHPAELRTLLPSLAGHVWRTAAPYVPGLYAAADRRSHDVQEAAPEARGLLVGMRDAMARETRVEHDAERVLPVRITDAAGLPTVVENDPRLGRPSAITDANGNRTVCRYTPLGLPAAVATLGRADDPAETEETPGLRIEYDLSAFDDRGEPLSARVVRRIHDTTDTTVPAGERDAVVEVREYWDGLGRLLQRRSTAAERTYAGGPHGDVGLPADPSEPLRPALLARAPTPARVLVSAWRTYDDKGRIVEAGEPYFSTAWGYAAPATDERRLRVVQHYDARGTLVRAVRPDGSQRIMVHGVPASLDDPSTAEPTPWLATLYDENDNAQRDHPASPGDAVHWNTPTTTMVDPLGRVSAVIERLRARNADASLTPIQELRTERTYDARGNLSSRRDPLGRIAVRQMHSLTDLVLRLERIDGGTAVSGYDAAGLEVEHRDARGAQSVLGRDAAGRLVRVWGRVVRDRPLALRERLTYGGLADRAGNRAGRLDQHYDEAGVAGYAYDVRGAVRQSRRRVVDVGHVLDAVVAAAADEWRLRPFRTDWTPAAPAGFEDRAEELLDPEPPYVTTVRRDALGRVRSVTLPEDRDGSGRRRTLTFGRDPLGNVVSAALDGVSHLEAAAYDAHGRVVAQRLPHDATGSGVMRRWAYDPFSRRLRRMRTDRSRADAATGILTPSAPAAPLQDLVYDHDAAGNVTRVRERAPDVGTGGSDAIGRTLTYDSLSRLVRATGRECPLALGEPWDAAPRCANALDTRDVEEAYGYDIAGNLTSIRQELGGTATVTALSPRADGNALDRRAVGAATIAYLHDTAGHLVQEGLERHFGWDETGRLATFRRQLPAAGSTPAEDRWAEPTTFEQTLRDGDGRPVMVVRRTSGGTTEATIAVGPGFVHRRHRAGAVIRDSSTVEVGAEDQPLALVRVGEPAPDDAGPALQRHLDDHLGSSVLVLGAGDAVVGREEYTPYGLTSFGGFERKRYRFAGRTRSRDSGLSDHGAREYAPWLARWTSLDPVVSGGDANPYAYAGANPLSRVDPDGRASRGADDVQTIRPQAVSDSPPAAEPIDAPADVGGLVPGRPPITLFDLFVPPREQPAQDAYQGIGPVSPPPLPPSVPFEPDTPVYGDSGTAGDPIAPEDIWRHPRIWRRVPLGPRTWQIESSTDQGRAWRSERLLTESEPRQSPPAPQTEDAAADGPSLFSGLGSRMGALVSGAIGGLMVFLAVFTVLHLMGSNVGGSTERLVAGALMAAAVGATIFLVLSRPDDRSLRPTSRELRHGGWTIRT